jgi:hypothetical protein
LNSAKLRDALSTALGALDESDEAETTVEPEIDVEVDDSTTINDGGDSTVIVNVNVTPSVEVEDNDTETETDVELAPADEAPAVEDPAPADTAPEQESTGVFDGPADEPPSLQHFWYKPRRLGRRHK